ncbi:hypothetical protein GCM10027570_18320 [Streptomonospora sediminis]
MNHSVSPAPQTSRTAPNRRRTRSAQRRSSVRAQSAAPAPAAPQATAEATPSDRPLLSWALVTDDNGRTRPEARWA